jgi:hypothetical protein
LRFFIDHYIKTSTSLGNSFLSTKV